MVAMSVLHDQYDTCDMQSEDNPHLIVPAIRQYTGVLALSMTAAVLCPVCPVDPCNASTDATLKTNFLSPLPEDRL